MFNRSAKDQIIQTQISDQHTEEQVHQRTSVETENKH